MNYSIKELSFVKECVTEGIRPDLRNNLEKREIQITLLDNPHLDGSLDIKMGYSHILLSVNFLLEPVIESNYDIPEYYLKLIRDTISLGMNIHIEIYNDDGNIRDMFFYGLQQLLKNIEIPDLQNNSIISTNINLPQSTTFAIFNDNFVKDPIKLEEESSDALVTVFYDDKNIVSFTMYKSGILNINVLDNLLKSL
ncbi:hypothetical protein NCER_101813 [Vairimorpha ceranae BRL01]|uniref:Uncharacterized protein n=2 Tax=Vairimorpha ceranae TaxID=40302 RepID=C4VAT7_VAIC1|nr:hypothetical protein AAJ76_1100004737 [Vairimorpha ceranae]EEQ81664.1 hypothetical protein NCER_101813 [Vairimorpha ceranae BRL01]KAF5139864.1 hypothetical protein G9O61_00g020340 [Vairimorpha ceranae]KKO74148.1 hypothetical protein AAJ76_1100004737 [Vairimorpha ceranae]